MSTEIKEFPSVDEDEYFVLMGFKDEKAFVLARDEEVSEKPYVPIETC